MYTERGVMVDQQTVRYAISIECLKTSHNNNSNNINNDCQACTVQHQRMHHTPSCMTDLLQSTRGLKSGVSLGGVMMLTNLWSNLTLLSTL